MKRSARILGLLLAAVFLNGPRLLACPVCYGASDDRVVQGAQISVLFMVGVTYTLLLGGGVVAVVVYRHRRRRASKLESG